MTSSGVRHQYIVILLFVAWTLWVCSHAFVIPAALVPSLIGHSLNSFPHWPEALWRAVRGVAGAAAVLVAAWQLGRVCLRAVPFERRLDAMLVTLAVGFVALDSILLLVARAGAYRPGVVAVTVLIAAALRPVGLLRDAAGLVRLVRTRMVVRELRATDVIFIVIAVMALGYLGRGRARPRNRVRRAVVPPVAAEGLARGRTTH